MGVNLRSNHERRRSAKYRHVSGPLHRSKLELPYQNVKTRKRTELNLYRAPQLTGVVTESDMSLDGFEISADEK